MAWNDDLRELQQLLSEYYSNESLAHQIADAAGISTEMIEFHSDALENWRRILLQADDLCVVHIIVKLAVDERPEDGRLVRLCSRLLEQNSFLATAKNELDEKKLIAFLEGLGSPDFDRIIIRLPKSTGYIPQESSHYQKVSALIRYVRSSGGPGLRSLAAEVKALFPNFDFLGEKFTIPRTEDQDSTRILAQNNGLVDFRKTKDRVDTDAVHYLNSIDNATIIKISGGPFLMGSDKSNSHPNERPQRSKNISNFGIYKYPITVRQFRRFTEVVNYDFDWRRRRPSWGWIDNHPMVNVSFGDAEAYCEWADVDLPTEAQWEKASRGTDGRQYPWGNNWEIDRCANNVSPNRLNSSVMVGTFDSVGESPFGVKDIVGNVWEWCRDLFFDKYYASSPYRDPLNSSEGMNRVIRGGAWNRSTSEVFKCTYRNSLDANRWNPYTGFRPIKIDV